MPASSEPVGVTRTPIPGLLVAELPVQRDSRGWFKENWQREKMIAAGLPDFGPVQHNVAFNDTVGTTRGIHAEPWDKWVSVAAGRVFGAWVDLRQGPGFGLVFTIEMDPSRAVFVPRGVGNAYQTLEPATAYSYLVSDHWSSHDRYTCLNLADETAAVPWPIPLAHATVSTRDLTHPRLADVAPVPPLSTLVVGADGQVGRALRRVLGDAPHVDYVDRLDFDITSPLVAEARRWRDYGTIINAAAFTAVDRAETPGGRIDAWAANVSGVARLVRIAALHRITLVHVSTDYVFDGATTRGYREEDPVSPLGVYAQTKAAADALVSVLARHYVVRTSWLFGDGTNFVRTMASLAAGGTDPVVVDDQHGRPTSADDVASGILHLLASGAPHGLYNLTGAGEPTTWAGIARTVFELSGQDPRRVTATSTDSYDAVAEEPRAPRPRYSVLDLGKIEGTGFVPRDWRESLAAYLASDGTTADVSNIRLKPES